MASVCFLSSDTAMELEGRKQPKTRVYLTQCHRNEVHVLHSRLSHSLGFSKGSENYTWDQEASWWLHLLKGGPPRTFRGSALGQDILRKDSWLLKCQQLPWDFEFLKQRVHVL
jgi:hypothetical protein